MSAAAAAIAATSSVRSRSITSGCSAISALASDTFASVHQYAPDLQPVVENDQVGARARYQASQIGPTDHARGCLGGGAQRRVERNAEAVQIADRVEHRQRGSGEAAIGSPDHAVARADR